MGGVECKSGFPAVPPAPISDAAFSSVTVQPFAFRLPKSGCRCLLVFSPESPFALVEEGLGGEQSQHTFNLPSFIQTHSSHVLSLKKIFFY